MLVLTLRLGELLLAFDPGQIGAIAPWPPPDVSRAQALAEALCAAARGTEREPQPPLSSEGEVTATSSCRALVVAGPGERFALGVPSLPQPRQVDAQSLVGVPRLLGRLGHPRWLAGFVEIGESLALLVDLEALLPDSALPLADGAPA